MLRYSNERVSSSKTYYDKKHKIELYFILWN